MRKRSFLSNLFDVCNIVFLLLLAIATLYPFWNVLIVSFSNVTKVSLSSILLLPKFPTTDSYGIVLRDPTLLNGFKISFSRTILGVLACIVFNSMVAYALSRQYFIFRKALNTMVVITMFISGGLIPFFLVVNQFHMTNTFIGLVIPFAYDSFGLILMKNYFKSIPQSLEESAKIDGAGDFRIFWQIFVPLSMPIIATMALFWAVFFWNDIIWSSFLVSDAKLQSAQAVLFKIIAQASDSRMLSLARNRNKSIGASAESIKAAAIIITTVPILVVYPFLQKYFVKGVVLGAVKE